MVTPETLTKVLTGNSTGLNGGKVLNSSKTSKVFVNFVDHGGPLACLRLHRAVPLRVEGEGRRCAWGGVGATSRALDVGIGPG